MAFRPDGNLQIEVYPFLKYKDWTFFPYPCLKEDIEGHFQRMKNFNSRDDDILMCTPQKSGTHWLHEIICMLVDQTTEYNCREASFKNHLDFMTDFDYLEAETRRRILHSHLPFSFQPSKHIENKCKVIFINRNPKDRHVSQYCFFRHLRGIPLDYSWEQYFNEIVLDDRLCTGWFNYTREMVAAKEKYNNVHIVLYEDLKLHPEKEVTRIAEFLEVPCDDEFIADIVDKCSFNKLKDHKIDASVHVARDFKSTLFRKGEIGDWKNWFTVAQNEQFNEIYRREMKGINIEFTYEDPRSVNQDT